jgi:Ca-activated chloride channel family protein
MQPKNKRLSVAVVGGFCLGIISAYAIYREVGVSLRPTRAHAEPLIHGAEPQRTAADTADPLAADRARAVAPAADPGNREIELSARVDRRAVMLDSDGQVQVQLTLTAPVAGGDAPRQPSDVLVVLDISGSMTGQKLAYAKRALHQLIGRITSQDRFGLVSYESGAEVVVPLQSPDRSSVARWHRAVDALETAGGTNMSAGLDLGLAQLARSERRGRMARVLLLSDGHANEGDSSLRGLQSRARKFVQNENVLTTMGIGDDFNEDLMTSLADAGTGNFYYLSRIDMIGRYFDAELRASTQTVARALELRFDAEPGTSVVDISGYPLEQRGSLVTVRPGNLYAGQKRTLWVTLQVPTQRVGQLALGRFSLAYKRNDQPRAVTAAALPALSCVADEAVFERGIDRTLWEENVTTQQFQKSKLALGRAIGEGDEADVDRELQHYESNRKLAEKLGSSRVLDKLGELRSSAAEAKHDQQAAPAARNYRAKQAKARATFGLRSDAYNDDPAEGL